MKIIFWILIGYSITQIIVETPLFRFWRGLFTFWWWQKLWSCIICTGAWVGFGLSLVLWSPCQETFQLIDYRFIFFDGMLCSVTSWFLHLIEDSK